MSTVAFMIAQTFIIDKNAVKQAEQVNISSVELYFKSKPYSRGNVSGSIDPGVNVYIVPTAGSGIPNFTNLDDFIVSRKEFSEIRSSRDATLPTKFTFLTPVPVKTGVEYAIIFKPDLKEGYDLWASTQGEISLDNNSTSTGIAGKFLGKYYELTTVSRSWQPLNYKSLKFHVNVARYAYDGVIPEAFPSEFSLNMKNYEFITYSTHQSVGKFIGGEMIYQDKRNITGGLVFDGTCSVLSGCNIIRTTGSSFAGLFSPSGDDSYIVCRDNYKVDVRKVIAVANNDNQITVDRPMSFTNAGSGFIQTPVAKMYMNKGGRFISGSDDFVILSDSSANSTVHFTDGSLLVGEISGSTLANCFFNDVVVHSVEPHVFVYSPPGTSYKTKEFFKYTTLDNVNGSLASGDMTFNVSMYKASDLDLGQPVVLMSRSNEVTLRNWSSTHDSESSRLVFNVNTTNDYASPQVDINATDVYFTKYLINDDATLEHTNFGNAISKHITTKVNFAAGRQAEDILVYLHAYKPLESDIKVYVKLFNSEDSDYFDDKDWTLLRELTNAAPSSQNNLADYIEYTYGLYDYSDGLHNTVATLDGIVNVTGTSPTVTGIGTAFTTNLAAGDLIKIYPDTSPEKYIIASVYAVDSDTSLTLNTIVTNTDDTRLGSFNLKIDKLDLKHQAFQNRANSNTVRYYNSNMTLHDKYDSFAIKIVLLSNNQFIIPKVATLRAVGVSA